MHFISAHAQQPVSYTPAVVTPATVPGAYNAPILNYVRTYYPSLPITDASLITTQRSIADVKIITQYNDGLGRVIQSVSRGLSTNGKDVVTPTTYNAFGLEQYKYLPYTSQTGNDGSFKTDPFNEQKAFYQNAATGESIFYSQIEYEPSPLNRALKTYAPGNNWAKEGGNHPQESRYQFNTVSDSVLNWNITTGLPVAAAANYAAGALSKTVQIDENGNQSVTFKDSDGHIVLKKTLQSATPGTAHVGWLCTYYVYDNLNNLRFVIPPLAIEKNNADSMEPNYHRR